MDHPNSDTSVPPPFCGQSEGTKRPESLPPAIAPNSPLPGTILSIQALRFVAAFMVVLFHSHVALVRNLPSHVPNKVDHAFEVGASGVHIFFVISGFVMAYTSLRSNLTPINFLKRRLIRIYPIYWITFGAYLAVHAFLGTPYNLGFRQIWKALLLLPGYSAMVIGPGWTLSFEMYFYLCFALALALGVRRALLTLSIFYFICVVAGRLLLPANPWGMVLTDSLLLEFICGAWLGFAYARSLVVGQRVGAALVIAAVVLFASGFWLDYRSVPSVFSWGIPSLLLVSGALAYETRMKFTLGRFIGRLGDSSYLLYLSHVLIIDLLLATSISGLNDSEDAAVVIALPFALACTAIGALGYKVIELPLLRALKGAVIPARKPALT